MIARIRSIPIGFRIERYLTEGHLRLMQKVSILAARQSIRLLRAKIESRLTVRVVFLRMSEDLNFLNKR
jgi:hypothetical protein